MYYLQIMEPKSMYQKDNLLKCILSRQIFKNNNSTWITSNYDKVCNKQYS